MCAVYSRGSWNCHWHLHMRSRLLILHRSGDMQSPVSTLCDYFHNASQKLNNVTFSNKFRFNCNFTYDKKIMFYLATVCLFVFFCLSVWLEQLRVKKLNLHERIFIEILPLMSLRTRKLPLNFGYDPRLDHENSKPEKFSSHCLLFTITNSQPLCRLGLR